jgi:hypothetical protein
LLRGYLTNSTRRFLEPMSSCAKRGSGGVPKKRGVG